MAKKSFILQGFTARTHKDAIISLFDVPDIERVIVSVAFVNQSGVALLESQLSKYSGQTKVFIGIRNDITSTQAAKHLLDLGVSLFLVDTGSRRVLFHPKVYLVKGASEARLIIGSANLTPGGLNNNIEAGIVVEFDLGDPDERALVESIEQGFDDLATDYPQNLIEVTAESVLDALQASGRLIDETVASPPRPVSAATSPANDPVPRIALKVAPLYSTLSAAKKAAANITIAPTAPAASQVAAAAASAPTTAATTATAAPAPAAAAAATVAPVAAPTPPPASGVEYELVWESKPLTRRDLNIPDGKNTNQTGSVNLDKGLLPDDVDQRHYFREEIFPTLTWGPSRTATVEEAYAKFQLVVKGISYGEFDLRVAHTMGTTSKTYKQNNAVTRLSWGPMRDYIAKADLISRTLSLYRDKADPKRFVLEID
ncbi:phospholipase D-like domain-containing protein [Lysobacter soli]|uniref:phospholipase D-like domain-containing protein n=1 Tax=Lysobacter soli TaxID=453783 RepID=UPI0015F2680E|nr:phospholipase D-like domain-containing protein [Lysobacter soli]